MKPTVVKVHLAETLVSLEKRISSAVNEMGKAVAGNNFIHEQQRHETAKCVHAIGTSLVEQEQENHAMWLTELMMENDTSLNYENAGPPQPSANTAMAKNAMAQASS